MNTSVKSPQSLSRSLGRSVGNAVAVFGIGSGLTLYITSVPYWEREGAATNLALVLLFVAAPVLLWCLARRASDEAIRRGVLIVAVVLAAVCLYGVLAALGVLPAAPWSPLG